MAKRKRDYDNDFPSVTQVLDMLRKPGLEMWFKMNTPEFIKEASEKGKTIGTQTHEAIENFINTGALTVNTEYPQEVTLALQSFALFRKEHPEIKLSASETKMTSIIHGFNGTMDIVGDVSGMIMAGDWKTGQAKEKDKPEIYDEYKTQISAYRALYNEMFNADMDKAFIASLAKDKVAYNYEIIEKEELDARFNDIFLSALKIKNFKKRK